MGIPPLPWAVVPTPNNDKIHLRFLRRKVSDTQNLNRTICVPSGWMGWIDLCILKWPLPPGSLCDTFRLDGTLWDLGQVIYNQFPSFSSLCKIFSPIEKETGMLSAWTSEYWALLTTKVMATTGEIFPLIPRDPGVSQATFTFHRWEGKPGSLQQPQLEFLDGYDHKRDWRNTNYSEKERRASAPSQERSDLLHAPTARGKTKCLCL